MSKLFVLNVNSRRKFKFILIMQILILLIEINGSFSQTGRRMWYPRDHQSSNNDYRRYHQSLPSRHLMEQSTLDRIVVGLKGAQEEDYESMYKPYNFLQNSSMNLLTSLDKRAFVTSPLSGQLIEIMDLDRQQDGENFLALASNRYKSAISAKKSLECLTIRTSIELSRDQVDKTSGLVVRSCKGLVEVNRCEGSCNSSVEPSIKSSIGLKKECYCCNEGSFKRIQVRLSECYSAINNRRITREEDEENSYLDISVEEPIDCKCRRCDGLV